MSLYSLVRPALFALDAERAHDLTMSALRTAIVPPLLALGRIPDAAMLEQRVFGLSFRNPVGLAAGLDKQGTVVPAWSAIGFGFAEIGTVTPRPQPGNPQPRLFRLRPDTAIVNRFGFNSEGAAAVAAHLSRSAEAAREQRFRIGINIGKNKDTPNERAIEDYVTAVESLHRFADYFVINVSSPNTAGLRALQDRDSLRPLVEHVVAQVRSVAGRHIPVLVKVSPDMNDNELLSSVDAAVAGGASGIVATNTTIDRSGLLSPPLLTSEAGGLSGAPLRERADRACRVLFRHLRGLTPIVGVGGILDADDAYRRIRSGAALVQLYTGLIYQGPGVVTRIAAGLVERLQRDGFSTVAEAVGIDAN